MTFDITDLSTILPQEESLAILEKFLHAHRCKKVKKISIDTMVRLTCLVLQEHLFVYDKKYDRQIIGGAIGSPLIFPLANVVHWNEVSYIVGKYHIRSTI